MPLAPALFLMARAGVPSVLGRKHWLICCQNDGENVIKGSDVREVDLLDHLKTATVRSDNVLE
jgi:hypothetical protein